uniref:DUF1279 domain-containing protein n=1 Tax=Anser brachyrhynchus TaxID=132585 RepID=A0A8B9I119_9AVES
MTTWRLVTETLRSWQAEKEVQNAPAQAITAAEPRSEPARSPEQCNLIDLGDDKEEGPCPLSPSAPALPAPITPPCGPELSARGNEGSWCAATDLSGEHKLNKSQQLKKVFKECGAVGVSFHVGISLVSLGIFYPAVSSGVDMTAVLFKPGFSESSLQSKRAAGTSTFLITIVSIGFFKPPTPNP